MGTLIFMLLCAAAEGFLILALVRFVQESRRNKHHAASQAVVVVSGHFVNVPERGLQNKKVISMDSRNADSSSQRLRQRVS
jgi:hypothetical protein